FDRSVGGPKKQAVQFCDESAAPLVQSRKRLQDPAHLQLSADHILLESFSNLVLFLRKPSKFFEQLLVLLRNQESLVNGPKFVVHYFRLNNNLLLIDDTNLRRTRFASGPDAES